MEGDDLRNLAQSFFIQYYQGGDGIVREFAKIACEEEWIRLFLQKNNLK